MRAHELLELFAHAAQDAEAVVGRQGREEVLHGCVAGVAGLLEQLGDDLVLVLGRERRRVEHRRQLGVGLELLAQRFERLGRAVEGGALGRRGELVGGDMPYQLSTRGGENSRTC